MITSPSPPATRSGRVSAWFAGLILLGWGLLRIDPGVLGPGSSDADELRRWLSDVDPVVVMLAGARLLGLALTGYLLLTATLTLIAERTGQQAVVSCLHRLTTHATRELLRRSVGIGLGASVLLGATTIGTSGGAMAQVAPTNAEDSITMTLMAEKDAPPPRDVPRDATTDSAADTTARPSDDVPRMEFLPPSPPPPSSDPFPDPQHPPDPATPNASINLEIPPPDLAEPETPSSAERPPTPTDTPAVEPGPAPEVGLEMSVDGSDPARSTLPDAERWVIAPGDHLWHVATTVVHRSDPTASETTIARYHQHLIAANQDRLVVPNDPDFVLPGQAFTLPPLAA